MTYDETVAWIHDRLKFGIRPGLTRIEELLKRLGNPQNKLKMVHIAGTNGKGSTTTFLRCLLEEQGLKVGTFSSPYVESFNERIAINGTPISNDELVDLMKTIKPLIEELDKTDAFNNAVEFEVLTGIMLQYFAEQEVDIAIVEVGLGGTYDATNVITPIASAIVTIGYDHMDILGNSLAEIAEQKAGIIKPNVPVVVGKVGEEARDVILAIAKKNNSDVFVYQKAFNSQYLQPDEDWGEVFNYQSDQLNLKHLVTGLLGKHQVDNASVALKLFELVAEKLHLNSQSKDIQKGLRKAFWPGRMEKISDEPFIVLDGAHNEPAVKVLVDNLKTEFKGQTIHVIFGALGTKDIDGMLFELKTIPDLKLKATTFNYPNALKTEAYEEKNIEAYHHWQEALVATLEELTGDDLILITGSLYFISEVRQTLLGGN